MNGYSIFMVLLAGYIAFLVATGYYFNKKQNSLRDFMLAGKSAGSLSIGFSAAASWLTAGALLAVIGLFILLGAGSIWGFVAPNIIALLIIALFVKKIKSIPAMTQPELLEIRYGSFLRVPVAIIIIVVMILFAVADIKGFALVLQVLYGISNIQAACIVGISVAVYVSLGGLSAVIATDVIQFICLSLFVLIMSIMVLGGASEVSGMPVSELLVSVDGSWWNPLSIGMPMVLIFCVAIIPGWITEQDPWQKVWAAKDVKSARVGLIMGSLLVTVVFAGCAIIAVGLNRMYPEIAEMGFPMGMTKAEPALLAFIMNQEYSDVFIALCAVALATAAMSCADTFAASGASCIARDIYQRNFKPSASIKEMLMINRLSVLFIVGAATLGSFFIQSIIDAIHIATFIASASYFFALMGGLYWRRGTAVGAGASMFTGFLVQSGFVIYDGMNGAGGGQPPLEALHPILMGHGVIVAMALSGIVYVGVSMLTQSTPVYRLAPFFKDKALQLSANRPQTDADTVYPGNVDIQEVLNENTVYLQVGIPLPESMPWSECVERVSALHSYWISLAGNNSVRRCTRADISSCVTMIRGNGTSGALLEVEGRRSWLQQLKNEVGEAYVEVTMALENKPVYVRVKSL